MKYDLARQSAEYSAKRYNEPYCIIQARNGQWMREKLSFVTKPPGSVLYSNAAKRANAEVVTPEGAWSKGLT